MILPVWSLITLAIVVIADCGVVLVRKIFKDASLQRYHEVTDPLLAVVGTLFSVLLGFMVASAMTRYDAARINIQAEAGAVGDMFRLARGLPEPTKQKLMNDCLQYTKLVIDEEWKLMPLSWSVPGQSFAHAVLRCGQFEVSTSNGEHRRSRAFT